MAKREPKPPPPEELATDAAIEILKEYKKKYDFDAYAKPFEDKILIFVCTPGQYPRSLRKRITIAIKKVIKPFRVSIHFVDQSPYRSKLPAPS